MLWPPHNRRIARYASSVTPSSARRPRQFKAVPRQFPPFRAVASAGLSHRARHHNMTIQVITAPDQPSADVDVIEFPHMRALVAGVAIVASSPLVVRLETSLLSKNREALRQRVLDELEAGRRWFVLDLTACGYVDAAGQGVLVSIARTVRAFGGELVITECNEDLATLFQLTKLDTVFRMAPRVIDALSAMSLPAHGKLESREALRLSGSRDGGVSAGEKEGLAHVPA